jgi:predicted N-formylglutamate amidohydrolase
LKRLAGKLGLVLSCEHAGNRVPRAYAELFRRAEAKRALESHRGFDPGALAVAEALARHFSLPLHAQRVTRLLVEVNRSTGHPGLYSAFSRVLSPEARELLLSRHYTPHRDRVEQALRKALAQRARVLHVAVHSFTPVLDGELRRADVGLLYDPARPLERRFGLCLQRALKARVPELRVRLNYPYRGASDGLTTWLRKRLGPRYLGFELELNQALLLGPSAPRRLVTRALCDSLAAVLSTG